MSLSKKTQDAITKYGIDKCRICFECHAEGNGAHTCGIYSKLTTRQADAAINAYREIFINDKCEQN